MTSRQFVTWHILQCEFGTGSWAVVDGILTVSAAHGSKSAQLGSTGSGEALARLLMWEMQNEQLIMSVLGCNRCSNEKPPPACGRGSLLPDAV